MLTFAESTRRTYSCQQMLYLKFCESLNISPVPISQEDLGRYIAFLSGKLCFSSIRQYLNIVRLMHLEAGQPNPMLDNWYISSILKGLKRCKGTATAQKLPITCDILQGIVTVLEGWSGGAMVLGKLSAPGRPTIWITVGRGWSDGAMVLGKLPVPGRPTIWVIVGQGPTALAVGAGGGCLDIFTLLYLFSPLSPSLWETARYRLKYCLKGPLNPKQPTNQQS